MSAWQRPVPVRADVVVVAAGASSRMGGIDKLAARIGGRPLLAWTLDAVAAADVVERVIVVTAADRVEDVRGAPWLPAKVVAVVAGGDRRQTSVSAGVSTLRALPGGDDPDPVILVHDGARPAVTTALIEAVATATARHGAAIPTLPVVETVKRIDGDRIGGTVDREGLATAQTPQGVRRSLLDQAYARFAPDGPDTFTDEAALLEACSIPVHVVDGEPGNRKVTTPADLASVAGALGVGPTTRTGIGHDSHPFGPAEPLRLGGIEIAGAPRLHGHSDGDVALHAICDALLGAAGLGDLGRLFPAGPATPQGIASTELLAEVLRRVADAGFGAVGVDVTITGARPRLGAHLEAMRRTIAAALAVAPERVNVKASTGNLDGMEGAGRGISALAVAILESRS